MKKKVFFISLMVLASGYLVAQSNENYRSRNHKLSKYGKTSQIKNKKFIVVSNTEIGTDFYDYLSRNSKFNKTESKKNLIIRKENVVYDYRMRNHKLKKQFKNEYNILSETDSLTTHN